MTNKNISLNVNDLGISKECSICFYQLLTDVVCCRECSKWIHKNCWKTAECPYCRDVKGWRRLTNIERTIRDKLKFKCEGCEIELDHLSMLKHIKTCPKVKILCECNKFIVREQLDDHLITCSPVSTASSHQSGDPEIVSGVGVNPTIVELPYNSENNIDPRIRDDPIGLENTSIKFKFNKFLKMYGKLTICVIIITTFISPYIIYHYMSTFEEPEIWYLECSVDIDKDHKNYNKSNPLDLCNEITGGGLFSSGSVGSLNTFYPIKVIRDNSLAFLIIVTIIIFSTLVAYRFDHTDFLTFSSIFIFFIILVGNIAILFYGISVEGSKVCPLLEDTFLYLESDKDNDYPDYTIITSNECEDLFSSIPRWIFISPSITSGLFLLSVFFLFCWFIIHCSPKERRKRERDWEKTIEEHNAFIRARETRRAREGY